MRWAVAINWVALGLDGADDRLASERLRDSSDRGDRAMVTAEASRPDPAVKEEVWQRLHTGGYPSLHLTLAAARGFFRRSQRVLERFGDHLQFGNKPVVEVVGIVERDARLKHVHQRESLVPDRSHEQIGQMLQLHRIAPGHK